MTVAVHIVLFSYNCMNMSEHKAYGYKWISKWTILVPRVIFRPKCNTVGEHFAAKMTKYFLSIVKLEV